MRGAVSGSVVSISNLPPTQTIAGTVTVGNSVVISSLPSIRINPNYNGQDGNNGPVVEADSNFGTDPRYMVVAGGLDNNNQEFRALTFVTGGLAVAGTVTIGSALPAGTNRIGVVTIGAGTVTIGAGTSQIGSVTASISGTVPVSISSVTVGNSVTIGSLPAISGTVTANVPNIQVCTQGAFAQTSAIQTALGVINENNNSQVLAVFGSEAVDGEGTSAFVQVRNQISGTVTANTFALQGTAVTTSNFTSTTASTVLAGYNATREVLTIFNEGAGNLHICAGATCTTIAYQVRLSAGDYYEVPNHQTTITHSAVFATAGTARIVQIS